MRNTTIQITLSEDKFDPVRESENFNLSNPDVGAIVSFIGKVRGDGDSVSRLTIECYRTLAEREVLRFANDAAARWPVGAIRIVHRIGDLAPGEPIVFVAAAAAHRRCAFAAVDFLMDYLKSEAPFWKQEIRNGVSCWIEPQARDHTDKMRWRVTE